MADLTINLAVAGSEVVTGALRRVGEVAINALGAAMKVVGDFAVDSFKGALEAQAGLDSMDAALKRVQDSSEEQAAAFAKASQVNISGTAASKDQLDKWSAQLAKSQARLADLQTRLGDKTPTETQKIQLQELQSTIAELNTNIQDGSKTVTTNLANSLGLVAPAAAMTRDELIKLSDKYKNLVGGSDDTVIAMETVGLTFNKIGREVFPRFIESSADLAVKLKMGPEQAATLLGKTLQDLSTDGTASIGRLRAAGVTLTDDQEKLIKKLVETGDAAGAQNLLLDILAKTTGGAASAAADTLQGRWAIFQETIADAGEGVAMLLLPPLTDLATNVLPPLAEMAQTVAVNFGALLTQIAGTGGNLSAIFDILNAAIPGLSANFGIIEGATTQLVRAFQASWPMIQAAVNDALAYIQGLIGTIMPTIVANTAESLNSLREFWTAHGAEIMAAVDFAFKIIIATIGTALTLISGIISVALQLINGDWEGAWSTIKKTLTTIMDGILAIVGTNLNSFLDTWRTVLSQLLTIVQFGLQRASDGARALIQGFAEVGKDIMRGLSDGLMAGIGWVKDAAIQAVQGAIDAAKHVLGIHSPSTVFAGIGANSMAGMAQGITANTYLPAAAAGDAARTTAQSTINNSGGNTYNYYGVSADVNAAYTRAIAGAY